MSLSSASQHEDTHPKLICAVDSLGDLLPLAISGSERLSRPFRYIVELADPAGGGPAWADLGKDWLGIDVGLDLGPLDPSAAGDNLVQGIVAAVEMLGSVGDSDTPPTYRIEIAPKLWLLSLSRRTQVYKNVTPLDVVKQLLSAGGVTFDMRAHSDKTPHQNPLLHITQYDETDLDFISRLLEAEGVCYWFEHASGGSTMVLANEPGGYPGSSQAINIEDKGATLHDPRGVGLRVALVPSEAKVAAYDFNDPTNARVGSKSITAAKAPVRKGEWSRLDTVWATGGQVVDNAAMVEADRQVAHACTFRGFSQDVRFRAGRRVKLPAGDCLLTEVEHSWSHPMGGNKGGYSNHFAWVSWSVLPWRPPRETPRPRLDALVQGMITATAGNQGGSDEAALDGSYMVRLLDPAVPDRVARLAQPYGGEGRGLHCPLPPDTEVLLAHLDGDPDRPVIAAAVPNFNHPGPVVDANKTQCVLKTGSGHNLVFEDKEGEEKISLTSKSGHNLAFEDKDGEGKISLTTAAGHKLAFEDKEGEPKIALVSTAGHTLSFEDKEGEEKASLISKSTHQLILDDKSGEEKITLKGKGGNSLIFDEKSGSEKISLNATKDHEVVVAGASTTTVTKAASLSCDDELTLSAKSKITLKVGNATIVIDSSGKIAISGTNLELDATSDAKLSATNATISTKANATISATGDAKMSGANASVEAQIGATVKGTATVEVSASGQATLKGAMVMIN